MADRVRRGGARARRGRLGRTRPRGRRAARAAEPRRRLGLSRGGPDRRRLDRVRPAPPGADGATGDREPACGVVPRRPPASQRRCRDLPRARPDPAFHGVGRWMRFDGWCSPHLEVTATAGQASRLSTCRAGARAAWRCPRAAAHRRELGLTGGRTRTTRRSRRVELAALLGDREPVERAAAWATRTPAEGAFGTAPPCPCSSTPAPAPRPSARWRGLSRRRTRTAAGRASRSCGSRYPATATSTGRAPTPGRDRRRRPAPHVHLGCMRGGASPAPRFIDTAGHRLRSDANQREGARRVGRLQARARPRTTRLRLLHRLPDGTAAALAGYDLSPAERRAFADPETLADMLRRGIGISKLRPVTVKISGSTTGSTAPRRPSPPLPPIARRSSPSRSRRSGGRAPRRADGRRRPVAGTHRLSERRRPRTRGLAVRHRIVGTGIVGTHQLTREAEEVIRRSRRTFVIDSGHGIPEYRDALPRGGRARDALRTGPTVCRRTGGWPRRSSAAVAADAPCLATYGGHRVHCYPTTLITRGAAPRPHVEVFRACRPSTRCSSTSGCDIAPERDPGTRPPTCCCGGGRSRTTSRA